MPAGAICIKAGDRAYPFVVVLQGRVEITATDRTGANVIVASHGSGEFVGDVDLLTRQAAVFTATAAEDCRLLMVDATQLREVSSRNPRISETILQAALARRELLAGTGATGVRLIGSRWDQRVAQIKELLERNSVPYAWLEPEHDPEIDAMLELLSLSPSDLPVVFCHDGASMRQPSDTDLAERLGLRRPRLGDGDKIEDLIIVGAGPAGMAAAVYAASEGLRVTLCDARAPGGQAATSSKIENYPGFPTGVTGADLARRIALQAQKFGTRLCVPCRATSLTRSECGLFQIEFDDGQSLWGRCAILATGARYRRLQLPNEHRFVGTSIFYGATHMEANLCADQPVAVVGGGNSAGQAAMFLSEHASHVILVVRGATLASSMSRYLVNRLEAAPNVEIRFESQIRSVSGDEVTGRLCEASIGSSDGPATSEPLGGIFVMIGAESCTEWLNETIKLDRNGFIMTGQATADVWPADRIPHELETSLPGLFAVGDVRSGSMKRVATSVGEGASVVRAVHQILQIAI
ncbi:MAG: FAD-dependent oxidoreductase [Planctomycetota bacterium]